jgi:FkbM family methyltransferase
MARGGIVSRAAGVKLYPPNYAFFEKFQPDDVVIDVGTADDPDFSLLMTRRFGLQCYCVDPTRKHARSLEEHQARDKRLRFLPYALGARDEKVMFFESVEQKSGSLLRGHANVVAGEVNQYPVQVVTLQTLLSMIGHRTAAILKIDIEGAEYELIAGLTRCSIEPFRQILLEFHHGRVEGISRQQTANAIHHIQDLGMKSINFNGRDCLFYWRE